MQYLKNRLLVLILSFPLALTCGVTQAQNTPTEPILINIMRVQLNPSGVDAFRSFHRDEIIPNQHTEGLPWRLTSAAVFGDSFEVVVATPIQNFAELDSPGIQLTDMGIATFQSAVHSRQRFILTSRPDLGVPGQNNVLPLRRLAHIVASPGKALEFEEFWLETIVPAMRNAGISGYQVFQTVIGGPQGEYYGAMYLPNYAAMDSLDMNSLLNARQQVRFGELVDVFEVTLVSTDRELSYGLPGL